jgi:hypothetical protein
MDPHDEETERYLKTFQPRAIRELNLVPQPRAVFWKRLIAAATVVTCAAGLLWFNRYKAARLKSTADTRTAAVSVQYHQPHPSILALTALALQDERKFDVLLDEESRTSLPRFQGERSSLRVLAKD